jgi:hypothetical protein
MRATVRNEMIIISAQAFTKTKVAAVGPEKLPGTKMGTRLTK